MPSPPLSACLDEVQDIWCWSLDSGSGFKFCKDNHVFQILELDFVYLDGIESIDDEDNSLLLLIGLRNLLKMGHILSG